MSAAAQAVWVALDQGGHASRALVYGEDGAPLAAAKVAIGTQRAGDDRVEHDPLELLESLRASLRGALADVGNVTPLAAGLATQRSSMLAWDSTTLEPLTPVLSWQDRRHAAWLESLAVHEPRIRALTGLPLSAHYGASKMRWCLDEVPAVAAAARENRLALGPLATWLASRLTGAPTAADPANAARTLLYDYRRGDWSDELLGLFGIERRWLPRCGPTYASASMLETPAGATSLAVVTGDQSAVPWAWGAPDRGTLFINLGTGGFLQRPAGRDAPDAEPLLASVLAGDDQGLDYALEGTLNGAGNAIDWICKRESLDPARGWASFAAGCAPDDPLFLNGIGGLGSPWWRSDFESRFVGAGDALAYFRAVAESIAFVIRANAEAMRGGGLRRVVLTGGLARADELAQACADALDVELVRPSVSEATAQGVATLLGAASPSMPGVDDRVYAPRGLAVTRERYAAWRDALEMALSAGSR